ncbi:MAG TPA: sucrase ferredoxin [Mycobacteriales bacterium]|nr:sucrase ferredoxin [Mycobacteriales bacterium]
MPNIGPASHGGRAECVAISGQCGEPLAGTAPERHGSWLLIEHPGPWPAKDPAQILPKPAAKVCAAAKELGVQVGLVRRTRDRRTPPPRHVVLASNQGTEPWLELVELADADELAHLDLAALASGRRPGFGPTSTERVLLVCTHGQRDRCCARHGRPVAQALAAVHGPAVWEATHVGGHRFAANVVCLPESTFHGRVDPDSALAVGAACLAGDVVLPHYRGRGGLPAQVQAAEHTIRVSLGVTGASAVTLLDAAPDQVRLAVGGTAYTLAVRERPGCAVWASCGDAATSPTRQFEAVLRPGR